MNDQETRRYNMLKRVQEFCATRNDDFVASSLEAELSGEINKIIADLEKHNSSKISGQSSGRASTSTKTNIRENLQEDLVQINRTAKMLAKRIDGLDDKFHVPRKVNDQTLLATARAFLADAEPLKEQFTRYEMPADFLETLQANIEAMAQAINAQNSASDQKISANAAIDDAIERGMDTVRELNAVVKNKYRDDSATLAAWSSASHVERPTRSNKKKDPN